MIKIVHKAKKNFQWGETGEANSFIFPAGEIGLSFLNRPVIDSESVAFYAKLKDSNDFFRLALAKNAFEESCLKRGIVPKVDLVLPYLPYARQDRVCNDGEPNSVKVFCGLLNSLKFNRVVVADLHSDVSASLIDNLIHLTRFEIIHKNNFLKKEFSNKTLISPDAGANKKTFELCSYFNHNGFVRADKIRDTASGKILETEIYGDVSGKDVLCVDDICDNGGTFIALAQKCKERGAKSFSLFVTHSILARGGQHLFDGGIDNLYTTDSYIDGIPNNVKQDKTQDFLISEIKPLMLEKLI